ncbi:2'-5' RNA ligase [Thiohalophilus thiocyanatoxydans]|uniref:RNA 2',3'-cyclic phosphodiesterase n=1 Tax=Thiohalophilus thiocyanatoxydans TaxID=381308 RepID=A0A4R8ING2_9GAMM|nr:2'-5' RNA ligase [Thiohalophilus thiocyanatoxydans]
MFLALWPPPELATRLHRVATQQFADQHARCLTAAQIHLTLFYLGPSDTEQRRCAEKVATTLETPPFTLALSRLGHWPRPRVGWIAPEESPLGLITLVSRLQPGLGECGFRIDSRPWQAHLTLVRKLRRPPLSEAIEQPLLWPVSEFVLVESRTRPTGVEYRILQRWPLNDQDLRENHRLC